MLPLVEQIFLEQTMKSGLTGFTASLLALVCISALAAGAKDTEALDKLKVIETINVTSAKEIKDSKDEQVDEEVLKILKVADPNDQGAGASSKKAIDQLKIIETINVTSKKEIDESKNLEIDAEVETVLKEAQESDEVSDSELVEAKARTKVKGAYAKKFMRDGDKSEIVKSAKSEDGKSAKLAKSQLMLKSKKLVSLAKTKELVHSEEKDEENSTK